jgi:hypothetical protein
MTFEGMPLRQAADALGKGPHAAKLWLYHRGYRVSRTAPRTLYRVRPAHEVEDEIRARIEASQPSAPCFRCGARKGCAHR